jgi:hypothetical protein
MPVATSPARYVDQGVFLISFATSVLVVCPKCGSRAMATCESFAYSAPRGRRINCSKCSFQRMPGEAKWLGPVTGTAKSRCQHCGFRWLKHRIRHEFLKAETTRNALIVCPSCGHVSNSAFKWTIERFGSPIDPIFGLPLWLQISCCGETLWAFNEQHIAILRAYIGATLRERTLRYASGMFYKLPTWMTAAKHRDAVLSGLARLEDKLKVAQ